ncbi:hypothetical protein D3C75_550120 [compost metagenome]
MLKAGHAAFRIQQMGGELAPGDNPDRGVGRAGAAGINDVAARLSRQRVVARRKTQERLRLRLGVAVEHVTSGLVVETLQLAQVLRGPESIGVSAQVGQFLIDQAVVGHHASGV